MATSSDFEADISFRSDSEVFPYDSHSGYMAASGSSDDICSMDLPSESDATCPSESYSQVMTDRREYDSDYSSNHDCWSQLFEDSDLDAFPEDPLLRDDINTDLGMNAPLYGRSCFSVIEAMLMVLRFSLRLNQTVYSYSSHA